MATEDWVKKIGRNIRTQRKRLGFTQEHLAELSELDPSYLSQIENGRQTPSLKVLQRLSQALKSPLSQLTKLALSNISQDHVEEFSNILNDLAPSQQEKLMKVIRLFTDFQEKEHPKE